MNVITTQGIKRVSEIYKRKLAKLKRDSGAEAVMLEVEGDKVKAICLYTGLHFVMPILKGIKP